MRLAVVGSRTIDSMDFVKEQINEALNMYALPEDGVVIVSGGAKGVDSCAQAIAKEEGYDFILFKPYHMIDPSTEYSPKFFFARNKQIADNADVVLILWDGLSHGTKHMIDYCKKRKKTYILYNHAE
jgi:predicted Rossmann fold nucleotide-binding protein DprA/Smf involved in DNA uptake